MTDEGGQIEDLYDVLSGCMSRAAAVLERAGVGWPDDGFSVRAGSHWERAMHAFGAALRAFDEVSGYLKLEQQSEATFALDLLGDVVLVLRRMEAAQRDPTPERLVQFAEAYASIKRLAAKGPTRLRRPAAGRPNLERQDLRTIYRWLVLATAGGLSESDAWDRVLSSVPGADEYTRGRVLARARRLIGPDAPSSNQRRPVLKVRAKALRLTRLAIAEDRLARAGL